MKVVKNYRFFSLSIGKGVGDKELMGDAKYTENSTRGVRRQQVGDKKSL